MAGGTEGVCIVSHVGLLLGISYRMRCCRKQRLVVTKCTRVGTPLAGFVYKLPLPNHGLQRPPKPTRPNIIPPFKGYDHGTVPAERRHYFFAFRAFSSPRAFFSADGNGSGFCAILAFLSLSLQPEHFPLCFCIVWVPLLPKQGLGKLAQNVYLKKFVWPQA